MLLVAAGFLAYAVAHSGRAPSAATRLYARFDNIDGLSVGRDVRLAGRQGRQRGQPRRIDPQTYQAVVDADGAERHQTAQGQQRAEITSDSLLGGKYLALSPGGDEQMLQPGQTITITQSSISIENLLGKFIFSAGNLAAGGKQGQLGRAGPVRAARGGKFLRRAGAAGRQQMMSPPPAIWPGADGSAGVLPREAAHAGGEPRRTGAVAAGCVRGRGADGRGRTAMRRILVAMVEGLESPKRAAG